MKRTELEIACSICGRQVTLAEDRCIKENGRAVHTDCRAKEILQDRRPARTAPDKSVRVSEYSTSSHLSQYDADLAVLS